jgi:hypothetical protein
MTEAGCMVYKRTSQELYMLIKNQSLDDWRIQVKLGDIALIFPAVYRSPGNVVHRSPEC